MPMLIGTSGWQYKHWRERFYPKGVPQRSWLEHYAERYQTVEINNSFYMLPKPEAFKGWADRTPDDFIVGVKMSRYLTHIKRLKDSKDSIERFFANARYLGDKIGPVLLQLPPNLKLDVAHLAETLDNMPKDVQTTVEFRHDSWYTEKVKEILTERNVPLTLADRGSKAITPIWRTADWGYVRWHQGFGRPIPCYRKKDMTQWAETITEHWDPKETVYAFFNNDPEGCAIRDSIWFAEECSKLGWETSRVPTHDDVTVGAIE
jgi:uncharacterized protein YecE (DUF72 family)